MTEAYDQALRAVGTGQDNKIDSTKVYGKLEIRQSRRFSNLWYVADVMALCETAITPAMPKDEAESYCLTHNERKMP